jgi:hypothetical protein
MVRCGGEEELRYTEKIARLCKEAYEEARRAMQAKHVLGLLPRFKAFSLDTSDASEFLSVMLQVIGVFWRCCGWEQRRLFKAVGSG